MPCGRCVIYMSPGDPKEIIGKARTGLLPIFKEQPGSSPTASWFEAIT
jgi:hypothetical protein